MEGTSSGRRDPEARETISDETHPKQGQTEENVLLHLAILKQHPQQ